ncbi:MAG: hypothetical protein K9I85_08180 [Saprospiraceae bacterium]|nr:hypothetical protein [Saprospiraceae bacterium]
MITRTHILFIGFLVSALIWSCTKDVQTIAYNPEIAVPLFTSSTSIQDLFGENTDTAELVVKDGNLTLIYRGEILKRDATELFKAIPPFGGLMTDTTITEPFTLENQIQLTKARFTKGTISVQINSNVPEDLDFVLEFVQVTKNGETLKINATIDYTGTLPVFLNLPPTDIAGYDIALASQDITVRYSATKQSDGTPVILPAVIFAVTDVEFSYLEGYFGYEIFDIRRDTISMDIFDNLLQGNLQFAEPKVILFVDNAFGFPVRSMVNVLRVSKGSTMLEVESMALDDGIDFLYPGLSEVGQEKRTEVVFDKDNSNFKDILNIYPNTLDYDIDAISNPDQIPDLIGFTTDSSYFRIGLQVELPLYGKASDYTADKEYEIDLSALDDISAAELKLVAENELPLEVIIQATLLDGDGNALATLLPTEEQILTAAPVDANGYSTGASTKITFIPADATLLEHMRNAKKVLINTRFSTSEQGQKDVRIRESDEVHIRLGLKATLDKEIGG